MDQFVGHGFHANDMDEFAGKLARRLQVIYKSEFSEGIVNRILAISNKQFPERPLWSEKDIVLITYGNSIQGRGEKPLRTLRRFVNDRLSGAISCIHILPFFPSTSDDGFAVNDLMAVNPSLGNWEDVIAFTTDFDLMADLVINHVSSDHLWFKNYLQNQTPGKDFFIEWQPEADYGLVVRPRNTPLFTSIETVNGPRNVWTTFSADQIDLNFSNPEVLLEMIRTMVFYISKGIRIIRLDAIAFLWKKPGTSSLHLPETHEIVKLLREIATFICPGTLILTETNVPNKENWSYFGDNDEAHMVYQFSLPPLLLHALFSENTKYLTNWADTIPAVGITQTFLNYTASHDGIGIRPLEGLLPAKEIDRLIERMADFGGLVSHKTNSDGSISPYEINITYFDAMKGNHQGIDHLQEDRFFTSQAIMLSLQGIPAIYIHSLMAMANDYEGVKDTGRSRSINRRQWDEEDLNVALSTNTVQKRLFKRLVELIEIRRGNAIFHPACQQKILRIADSLFAFERNNQLTGQKVTCISNMTEKQVIISSILPEEKKGWDLISGDCFTPSDPILLSACQTRWIVQQDDMN